MNRFLRGVFVKIEETEYGPRPTNPIYKATANDGAQWRVERHQWVLPTSAWAWRAEPIGREGRALYADTLAELAHKLGHPWAAIEGES